MEPILQKVSIIRSGLLYFNFKTFMDPNYWSFNRFKCILVDSAVSFQESWSFYKLKRRDLISGKSGLFGAQPPPLPFLLYFNFKTSKDPNSFLFITISMHSEWSRSTFVRALKFLPIKGGGDLISGVNHLCRKSELFVLHLLYFNFKIFKDRNFSLIITFQCILLDYGWPVSDIQTFQTSTN